MILTSNSDRASDSVAIGGYQDKWAWMGLYTVIYEHKDFPSSSYKHSYIQKPYISFIFKKINWNKHEDIL